MNLAKLINNANEAFGNGETRYTGATRGPIDPCYLSVAVSGNPSVTVNPQDVQNNIGTEVIFEWELPQQE